MMTPNSEAELAEIVAGAEGSLWVQGGGTRGFPAVGNQLSTKQMKGVELYEPGALTLVAKAGTPVEDVEKLLAEENQRLAFEPMDHRGLLATQGTSTLGGVVAVNVSGPRRIQAGACRDFLLGVRFVDGAGQVIKNGGRVMKNVTGYDLVKLMAGSHGTLGVLSEVSLKVLPAPEMKACLLIDGLGIEVAVRAMSRALGSPYEISGAAHVPVGLDGTPVTMIRIEGFEASVSYRLEALRSLLAEFGDSRTETDQSRVAAGWRWIRDVVPFHQRQGDVWRLSVKPSDAPGVAEALDAEDLLLDLGGGLVWALVPEGTDLRARLAVPGHATLVRAEAGTRARLGVFHPQGDVLDKISAGLRQKFDPRGILNPRLMG